MRVVISLPVLVQVDDLDEASELARLMEAKMREGTAEVDVSTLRVLAATITITSADSDAADAID